jgi:hypothetical protein
MYNTMVVDPTEEEEEVLPLPNSILKLTAIPKTQIEESNIQILVSLHRIK